MSLLQKLLRKSILSFILLISSLCNLSAQNVKNFTLADGLSGNSILCIFKDSNGLLWIGTETGLCTYDGNNFKTIGEEQGLKYNIVRKIIEDDKNNLWLSVFGDGIAKFDGKKFTYYNNKDGLINNSVRSMFFSKKHNSLVLGTEEGLSVFNGKEFVNFKLTANNYNGSFQVNFINDYKGKIIFGVNNEYLYELKINKTDFKKSEIQKYYSPNTQNYTGFIDGNNFYSRSRNREFVIHNLKNNSITNLGECPTIWDIVKTENNEFYASGWEVNYPKGGLLKIKNGKITDLSNELKLPTSKFWCLYYDLPTKQLITGSVDQGIFIIDLSNQIKIESNLFSENSEINCIFIDDQNNLWLGGNNFITKKTKTGLKTLTNENLKNQILKIKREFDVIKEISFKNNFFIHIEFNCYSIKQDNTGAIWAHTNYGILCFDTNLNLLKHGYITETGGIFEFIDDTTFFASLNYNHGYVVSKRKLTDFKEIQYQGKSILLNAIKIAKHDSKLWIATKSKGLFLFKDGELISLNDLGFYSEKNLSDIIVDSKKNIITATKNGKVYFSNWNNNQLTHFKILKPEKDIIGNSVFFVRQYNEYYIIGTNKGVNIVKDFKLHKFLSKEEHLPATEYKDAIIDYSSNELLISTYKGLISMDLLKVLQIENFNSPIYINQIKVNNENYPVSSELNLDYNENNIEINFNSNNILNATKNYYRFKILGLSNNWSKYSKESNLKLLGLNSGNYTIVLEGKNIGTGEILKPIQIKLNISYPFWETWWFIGLMVLALILIILFVVRRKINHIKEKSEIEKRIAETKLLALQSQMNPHFVFNAMNSIQNFVIDNNVDDALFYIGEFSKLIRQTLDFSGKKYVYLFEEIEYLNRYIELENLRRKVKVDFKIKWDKDINTHEIEISPMLIQPIVENVFIHAFDSTTTNPKLQIEFSKIGDKIFCLVTDNGKGFVKSNKSSKGLKLVKERIQLLSTDNLGKVAFQNTSVGTAVKIEIPIR